jgi:hypothetical protein
MEQCCYPLRTAANKIHKSLSSRDQEDTIKSEKKGWGKELIWNILLLLLLRHYSPTWALASSILCLQASLSSANLLQFLHFNIPLASLSTASNHQPLSLPTGLLLSVYPFRLAKLKLLKYLRITLAHKNGTKTIRSTLNARNACYLSVWYHLS